jgi:c-di-GMP-binding flagellar brake protein YcgR
MSDLFRSIVGRLREFARDRRWAPRRRAKLPFSVTLHDVRRKPNGSRPVPALKGHTEDISTSGLALIVPAIRIGERYLSGEDRTLQIVLELPSGPVQILATPARYERLDEKRNEDGYLIGVRITQMSDEHRKQYLSFLKAQHA